MQCSKSLTVPSWISPPYLKLLAPPTAPRLNLSHYHSHHPLYPFPAIFLESLSDLEDSFSGFSYPHVVESSFSASLPIYQTRITSHVKIGNRQFTELVSGSDLSICLKMYLSLLLMFYFLLLNLNHVHMDKDLATRLFVLANSDNVRKDIENNLKMKLDTRDCI